MIIGKESDFTHKRKKNLIEKKYGIHFLHLAIYLRKINILSYTNTKELKPQLQSDLRRKFSVIT